MLRRVILLVLAGDCRHRRRFCGVICNVSIVLLRATFLLATELLPPLWRGLTFDCGRLSTGFWRLWLSICHTVGLSSFVTTGLPPGWLINSVFIINFKSRFEEVCVLSLWGYNLEITFGRSLSGTVLHNILYRKLKLSLGNSIGIDNRAITLSQRSFQVTFRHW